jgi:CDP-glycerol glycerophosphotransferase
MKNQAFLKVVFSELVKIVTFPFRLMPIRKNRILFTGLTGGNVYDYSCNPKYLYEYMRDRFPGQFQYVWAVSDKEKYSFLEEQGVKVVKHFTISSVPMLLTSKVIVTNGSYAPWFPFRSKQYVINTWHGGGAYKKVENERPDANWATRKRAAFCAGNIDLFLASCKIQEEQMIRTTYQYTGDVLRAGTPRNDKLVKGEILDMARRVREAYHIPENGKLVLYAPTYRKTSTPVVLDSDFLLAHLNEIQQVGCSQLTLNPNQRDVSGYSATKQNQPETSSHPAKWYFLSRYHRYQDDSMDIHVTGSHVIDVCDYPDMQELLCAADVLITDYSSCVWDYSFLKRPCFLFVPDKEEYTANTGFYVSVDKWPFTQARTMEELAEIMKNYDEPLAKQQIEQHLQELGNYEGGECCKGVADRICEEVMDL